MCGLVGIITKKTNGFTKEQCEAFSDLLFVDSLRGMDSTGVFLVDKEGNMDLLKEASDASTFRRHQDFKDLMNKAFQRGAALIGHNRAATKGAVVDQNAHPFVVDDRITLVHNGTLWNHKQLADTEVDSHAIAHTIHKHGDNVEAAMQEINGAYALIWHDFQKNTVNFLRNNQRPLNWIELEDCWMYASEMNMMAWVIGRHNLKTIPNSEICPQPEGTLTTFTLGAHGGWSVDSKKIQLERPKSTYTPPVYPTGGQQQYGGRRHPYAGCYSWPDDDDDNFGYEGYIGGSTTKPVESVVVPMAQPRHTGNLDRIRREEQRICRDQGIDVPCIPFMEKNENDLSGTTVTARCIDFFDAFPNSPSGGYYVYAKVEGKSQFLIKQYLPGTTTDNEVLDLCLNGREAKFSLRSREWCTYNNAEHGQGFGLYVSTEMVVITETVKE